VEDQLAAGRGGVDMPAQMRPRAQPVPLL
jgi:hypothetical protein